MRQINQQDIIISGGENISSLEVESIMMKHEKIAEVAVVARCGLPGIRLKMCYLSPHLQPWHFKGTSKSKSTFFDFGWTSTTILNNTRTRDFRLAISMDFRPDEKWGETPVAWIVCRNGMTLTDEDVDVDDPFLGVAFSFWFRKWGRFGF